MKKLTLVLLFSVLLFASCTKRYTCPTYLKNTDDKENIRVKNELKKSVGELNSEKSNG